MISARSAGSNSESVMVNDRIALFPSGRCSDVVPFDIGVTVRVHSVPSVYVSGDSSLRFTSAILSANLRTSLNEKVRTFVPLA